VQATPSLLQVLGVQPSLGRWFAEEEASPEGDLVVVLSHALWVNRFGADPKIVGGTTRIDGAVYEVIGVMPESFAFPDERGQFYIAQKLDPAEARPGGFNYEGIARLKPGVTVEELTRQFAGVIAQLPEQFPEHLELAHSIRDEAQLGALPLPFKERVLGGVDDTLWVLLGAVGIVLLIACANLANLFLVRTESRQREIAVRRALGAGTRKIVGYYLSETLLVAFASGLVGLLSAYGAVQVLVAQAPVALPRLQEIRVGPAAAGYALLLAMLAGASFAVLPMLRRLPAVSALLKEGGRGSTAGVRPMRARQTLMAAQVALAVMLLVAAALVMQSFMALRRVDPGFRAESRLVFRIGLPPAHTPEATIAFHEQLLARLGALPGVESAAVTTTLPLEGWGWGDPLDVRGRTLPPGDINPVVAMRRASPGIFETLGTPLRSGRRFTAEDMRGHTNAAIINEALAARYFPGGNALGQQVRPMGQEGDSWFTIVGVVANTVTDDLVGEPAPQLYLALRTAITDGAPTVHAASYVVRSEGSPTALIPAVRRLLDEIDPELAIARPEPMTDMVMRASATTAFTMVLLVIAGLVAVTLGLIGVYAVIAYAVAQRTGEIGLRLALGARPHDVTSMIVGQSGMVIAIGVVLGLAGAAVGTRALQSMLYGVAALDALTFASVAVGLFAVALAACWVPAQKASRLSPLQSLRGD
jgi:predicted permease